MYAPIGPRLAADQGRSDRRGSSPMLGGLGQVLTKIRCRVTTSEGVQLTVSSPVGADGVHSTVRKCCFPDRKTAEFLHDGGIDVRPHPHIGLATVTYLCQGQFRTAIAWAPTR